MKTRERIEFDALDDNPWQPRQEIEPEALEKLAGSIAKMGLLQVPLGRRMADGRVQVAFGHRRIAACRQLHEAGHWEPYVEMDVSDEITDEEMAVMALTENVDRRQLTQMEVLRAQRKAVDDTGLSIESLAEQLGIGRSTLSNNLRVLELPDSVLEYVASGALRVGVAKEFLVLQNGDHCHAEDMQSVINGIVRDYRVVYQGEPSNWSRRNVRQLIATQVSGNEQDFRPLGPYTGGTAGAARKATFDVDAFSAEFKDTLHTIPAPAVKNERPGAYDGHEPVYSGSRLWTCEVKEWSRRQTRATREANKTAEVSGTKTSARGSAAPSRDKQFEQALSKDLVWKGIVARRKKKGPNRPVTEEEKAALGTRAELNVVDVQGDAFWKKLENGDPKAVRDWEGLDSPRVPPYFDLSGCQGCVAGAAYATSSPSYYWSHEIRLICANRSCYDKKLSGYTAAHREKVEAQLIATDGVDRKTIKVMMGRLAVLTRKDLRTLASTLIAAQPELELTHTMGVPHKRWSYKPMAVRYVTGLLTHQPAHFDTFRHGGMDSGKVLVDLESLDQVPADDLLELTASLMTYHLRQAGKLETVPQGAAAEEV